MCRQGRQQQLAHAALNPKPKPHVGKKSRDREGGEGGGGRGREQVTPRSGDSVIDANKASVRALSKGEREEADELERMEDREALLKRAMAAVQNEATLNSSFSGAYLTLRNDLRAHAVMDREEHRIRSGESAFVDGLETHNLEAFDRSLSPATRAATARPEPNDNTSKWCGKRAPNPLN